MTIYCESPPTGWRSFVELAEWFVAFPVRVAELLESFTELGDAFTELYEAFTELYEAFTELNHTSPELCGSFIELNEVSIEFYESFQELNDTFPELCGSSVELHGLSIEFHALFLELNGAFVEHDERAEEHEEPLVASAESIEEYIVDRGRLQTDTIPIMRTRKSRMRTLVMIVLLLIGGAIINVAVAWGTWRRAEGINISPPPIDELDKAPPTGQIVSIESGDWHWLQSTELLDATDLPWRVMHEQNGFGYRTRTIASTWRGFWEGPKLLILEAGWPAISLDGALCVRTINDTQDEWLFRGRIAYPLRPLWPAFLINSALYGWVLYIVLITPFFIRRMWRIRKRRCAKCAYPIGVSDTCTECGRPVKRKIIAHYRASRSPN